MMNIPQSVPIHLISANPPFWIALPSDYNWSNLDLDATYAISGSAFIDITNSNGPMGNPFAVILGNPVKNFNDESCRQITQITRTPETIFIRDCHVTSTRKYQLLLTVMTPIGKELGACAHGFIGAIQTLLSFNQLPPNSEVMINTTLGTTAKVFVASTSAIAIEFVAQKQQRLTVLNQTINNIFQVEILPEAKELPILSVGSPKLTIEVSPDIFNLIQKKLGDLDYHNLLAFQNKEHLNGIHVFCRHPSSHLPKKTIQVNAYLGEENVIDRATGVSAAGQISADPNVSVGTEVTITQYIATGPSAILKVKKEVNCLKVGGAAVLFNYRKL